MHHRHLVLVLVLAVVAAALLAPAAALAAPADTHGTGMLTYDQAVDYLFAKGYPQNVETYLSSLGTSPLGYRLAGTPSDNAAAFYIRDKLRGMGLTNVHLEKVPVDVWDVRGASLTVGDAEYTCSQFAGVPGVDAPVTADVVYVGSGLAADYEGVDVKGKIVLVDSSMDNFWFNFQGAEATKHGAAAVVLTSNYSDPDPDYPSFPWYSWAADALGGNDGEYDMSYAPMIYLSQQDGDALKAAIASADPMPVEATFASDVRITMATDGGFGYNVLATLPGSRHDGQKVILNAHHDSHLRAGLDDTGAVAETLALAKAMKLSGYTPKRDIVFLFDTAEEFGYTNSWYDWSIGAWNFITQQHPDWAGKIAAMWSIELMAREGATLDFNTSPELTGWLHMNAAAMQAAQTAAGVPLDDYTVETPQSTWQNGWSFQGMGVPSFEVSAGGKDYDLMYHSTYEVQSELDWDYMARIDKFFGRLFGSMDGGVLPYDFAARGQDLKAAVDADELEAAGREPPAANELASPPRARDGGDLERPSAAQERPRQRQRVLLAMASRPRSTATRLSTPGITAATRTSRPCGTSSTWTRRWRTCRPASMGGTVARNNGAIPGAEPVKDGKSNRGRPICGLRHGQTGGSAGVKSWTTSSCFVTFASAA